MDDIPPELAKKLVSDLQFEINSQHGSSPSDYIVDLCKQKSALECQLIRARNEINALRLQVEELPREGGKDTQRDGGDDRLTSRLKEENRRLGEQCKAAWGQIAEMKEFLSDYGMVWIGAPQERMRDEIPRVSNSRLPFHPSEIQQQIDELNNLAGDYSADLPSNLEPIDLVLFSKGFKLHTQPFLPYHDIEARAILKDVKDGFFPMVLKKEYPHGVPLRLVDMTCKDVSNEAKNQRESNIHGLADIGKEPSEQSRSAFINRLPEALVKDGKIVNIRSEIEAMFRTASLQKEALVLASPAGAMLKTAERGHIGPCSSDLEANEARKAITTLQIKRHDGKQNFIIRLFYDDTIGTLCRILQESCPDMKSISGNFELRSTFPQRIYTCLEETLAEAGLVPSATLFIRLLEH